MKRRGFRFLQTKSLPRHWTLAEPVDRIIPPRVEYQTCRCEFAMKPEGTELCPLMAHTAALGQLLAR